MQYEATVPDVIDRVVQEAVRQVLEPLWEPTFHPSSHGFRPGRSCHTAIAEAKGHLEDGYEWCVDLDLEKFFDLVCHQRLAAKLAERVSDRRLLVLIGRMLKAKVVLPDGVVIASEQGVPQGGPLSPLLSNIVLDELDRELDRRGHRFVRYADDAKVYVRSERAGQRVMASLTEFIERRLRLKVNQAKSAVARPEERHFLGFRLRVDPQTGVVEVLLSERTKRNAMERIRQLTPRNWGDTLESCIAGINAWLRGWHGFFGIASVTEMQVMRKLDAHIRRRLRAIILRHWKRKRTIALARACDQSRALESQRCPTPRPADPSAHRPDAGRPGGMAEPHRRRVDALLRPVLPDEDASHPMARQHLPEALGWEEVSTVADLQAVQALWHRILEREPDLFAQWQWVRSP